uniref:probable glycosyltransferase At5g03795 n=1 Tax=Erigeron canadensis TaxID=72917 RepID=UPI001CB954F3|nr:probable glycosyltransferase At5g03795 [Erigeron canadensis]
MFHILIMGYGILRNIRGIQRLVYFGGVIFAVFVVFRYLEFPYGDVISSLFSANNIFNTKTERFPQENPSPISEIYEEITQDVNSTASSYSEGNASATTTTLAAPINLLDSISSDHDRNVSNSVGDFTKDEASTKSINVPWVNVSSVIDVPNKTQQENVVSISEMHDILVHNRASSHSTEPRWRSRADQQLLKAKLQIENAQFSEDDDSLYPSVFRNISMFRRSYELMEKTLKVYIYKEGEKPIFHQPEAIMKGIYASEGWFMKQMKTSKRFVTRKPKQAHLFYIPYSSKLLKETLYSKSHDRERMVSYLKNYLDMIAGRYSFWNRTGGADHFLVACHDWAAYETRQFMGTCIRAICNTDVEKAGFELGKDVSLPEANVRYPQSPLKNIGGKPPSKRSVFAFFAGQKHGYLRSILLHHWENKDSDMKIFRKLPKVKDDQNYVDYMKSSKFCICAKGYEVHSPRVVESIFYECVPVIISDNFVPPFFEVLDWGSFAVFIPEKDIPDLKNILLSIPIKKYLQMHRRVKEVQQHFLWHVKPIKYDIFHMILHSVWYTRVLRVNPR